MSLKDIERFIWNQRVKNKGGRDKNIPMDLEIEHSNLFNKVAIKNLGPNVTEKAVKITFSESGTIKMAASVDNSIKRIIGSGKHTSSSTQRDLSELVRQVALTQVFTPMFNQQYHYFKNFERDPFKNLNMSAFYKWINQHRQNVLHGNKAR